MRPGPVRPGAWTKSQFSGWSPLCPFLQPLPTTAPLSLSLGTSTDGTHSWWPLLNTGWPLLLSASWPLGPQPHSVMALLSSCDHSSWPVTPSAPPTRGHDCPCHLHFTGAQCKAGYRDRAKSLLNRSFHLTPAVGRAKGRLSESLG